MGGKLLQQRGWRMDGGGIEAHLVDLPLLEEERDMAMERG